MKRFFARTRPVEPAKHLNTWPTWNPLHSSGDILAPPDLCVEQIHVLDERASDHLSSCLERRLPAD